jgi:hypothetical protein
VKWYLGTPGNTMQAHAARGMPVLVSYGAARKLGRWVSSYARAWDSLLIDSGAYSELGGAKPVDLEEYFAFASEYPWADAVAGLDDIRGDWRRSLKNYERGGFPTFHDTDPPELLADLIPIARERGGWLGIGLLPPRTGREAWLLRTVDAIPHDVHIHGWALGAYASIGRIGSIDSTNWWRDVTKLLSHPNTAHLTPGEALDIIVSRYRRFDRKVRERDETQGSLFDAEEVA